jgi:hypothetical protein
MTSEELSTRSGRSSQAVAELMNSESFKEAFFDLDEVSLGELTRLVLELDPDDFPNGPGVACGMDMYQFWFHVPEPVDVERVLTRMER